MEMGVEGVVVSHLVFCDGSVSSVSSSLLLAIYLSSCVFFFFFRFFFNSLLWASGPAEPEAAKAWFDDYVVCDLFTEF